MGLRLEYRTRPGGERSEWYASWRSDRGLELGSWGEDLMSALAGLVREMGDVLTEAGR